MSLETIASRIADTAYWSGPYGDGDMKYWIARVPFEGGMAEAGEMKLTDQSLTITDRRNYEMHSRDNSTHGHYLINGPYSSQTHNPYGAEPECVVTIAANDEIVSSGPLSRLMLHWLAHGLLE